MENLKDKTVLSPIPDKKNLPKNTIVLNEEKRESGLPDLVELTGEIIQFVEFIETAEMKELCQKNYGQYRQTVEEKFDNFTLNYYSIYKMLFDDEKNRPANLEKLFKMINRLKDVENGKKNIDLEFFKIREELAEEFLYPQFGGKEKFAKAFNKDKKKK